jgi:hypothetical protein
MRAIAWVLSGFITTGVVFFLTTSSWFPRNTISETLVFLFFALPSIGAFWMLYVVIRKEKSPLLIFVAFVPFGFLWYYFERFRPGQVQSRRSIN